MLAQRATGSGYRCTPHFHSPACLPACLSCVLCMQGLLVAASPGVDVLSLGESGNWAAVPATLPVVALAFVYHNVVPVVVQALGADRRKVTAAICAGVAIPWLMFVSWEAAILGSLGSLQPPQPAAVAAEAVRGATGSSQLLQQVQQGAPQVASSSPQPVQGSSSVAAAQASAGSRADPLAALAASNDTVGPLIQGFSFLAIATSFIGFILGLTDFFVDGLKLPSRQAPVPYALTLLPPFAVAVSNPDIFLQALDTAGGKGGGACGALGGRLGKVLCVWAAVAQCGGRGGEDSQLCYESS